MDRLLKALRHAHTWEIETSREMFSSSPVYNNDLIQALEHVLGTVPGWIRTLSLTRSDWKKIESVRDLRTYLPPGFVLVAVDGSDRCVYGYTRYDLEESTYDLRTDCCFENGDDLPPLHMISRPPSWLILR